MDGRKSDEGIIMEKISNVIGNAELEIKRREKQQYKPINEEIKKIVDKIFVFFYSICRGFDKQYSDPRRLELEKAQWVKALEDEGITKIEYIEFAIKRCRKASPINTPTIGQFLKWCNPNANQLGLPDVTDAYDEAVRNSYPGSEKKWSHEVVYQAWIRSNPYSLCRDPSKQTFLIFEENYAIAVKMYARGEKFKDLSCSITDKTRTANKGLVLQGHEKCTNHQSAMDAMKQKLGMKVGNANKGRMQENPQ